WLGQSVGGTSGFFNSMRSALLGGAPLDSHAAATAGRAYALGERPTLSAPPLAARNSLSVWPAPTRGPVDLAWPTAAAGTLEIAVFDVSGRQLRRWSESVRAGAGLHTRWDGRDAAGRR